MASLLSTARALGRRSSSRYPHSLASIGPEIGIIDGRECWWEAIGPAKQDFEDLFPKIKSELEDCCKTVETGLLICSVYMIGRSIGTAYPAVIFSCKQKTSRKDAMRVVQESGILKEYPGWKVGSRKNPPGVDNLIQPANHEESSNARQPPSVPCQIYFDASKPVIRTGMILYFKFEDGAIRRSTASLIIDGDNPLFLTVSHVLQQVTWEEVMKSDDIDSDYEIASDAESEGEVEENDLCMTSQASVSSAEDCSSEETSYSPSPDSQVEPIEILDNHQSSSLFDMPNSSSEHRLEDGIAEENETSMKDLSLFGVVVEYSLDLDWLLISPLYKVRELLEWEYNHYLLMHIMGRIATSPRATNILVPTSNRLIYGYLSETPLFAHLPNSRSYQKIYKAQVEGKLAIGDCGAIVIDVDSQLIYGYIVAASETNGIIYIMAARHVFEDLQAKAHPVTIEYVTETTTSSGYLDTASQIEQTPSFVESAFVESAFAYQPEAPPSDKPVTGSSSALPSEFSSSDSAFLPELPSGTQASERL